MNFFNKNHKVKVKKLKNAMANFTSILLLLGCGLQANHAVAGQEPVIASGVVPDEQTRQQIISKLKSLYGDNVVDQITVAAVTMPPEWRQTVLNSIQPELKNVSKGRLEIAGSNIQLSGKVPSEAIKATLAQQMTNGISSVYKVKQLLEINASEQKLIDQALGNRIVEFESGSAILTPVGQYILDEMAVALNKVGNKSVRIIGHTDSQGNPVTNLGLSLQRANAVRDYLAGKGVNKILLRTEGLGANQPIADNSSEEGRRRNRRIEFEVL
ncbi:OmpA family protein [Alkanindiges illinoisensis]|uniref:OmpA family protein n=1 Tax=Alkanindiges illinoisensis TaxID=197183 RepID=UPI001D178DEA